MSSENREGKGAPDPFDVPLIISVDDHVCEPPDNAGLSKEEEYGLARGNAIRGFGLEHHGIDLTCRLAGNDGLVGGPLWA